MDFILLAETFTSENINKKKKINYFNEPTSGKLHKMPQVTYNLEPICGSVAVIGDLTNPCEHTEKEKNLYSK